MFLLIRSFPVSALTGPALALAFVLSGCVSAQPYGAPANIQPQLAAPVAVSVPTSSGRPLPAGAPVLSVAARVLPVAEQVCRASITRRNCDFIIAVDDDPAAQANAFQTLDPQGRPIIVFTAALLAMAQNPDEIAFVFGHEAAHHIAGHIPRRQDQAMTGAIVAGVLAQVSGLTGSDLARVQEIGAGIAAQQYSKEFELEADSLGAEMAWYANYDPLKGAAFFSRLPDPSDRLMGSHPPNAQRQAVVAQTVARLKAMQNPNPNPSLSLSM